MTAAPDHDGLITDAGAFEVGDPATGVVMGALTDAAGLLDALRGRYVALRGNAGLGQDDHLRGTDA